MTLLIVIHILVCIFLVCVILLQPGKADGGGIGFGSSSQSIFGSKGAGNFLTKTTTFVAVMYLLTSFILTRSRIKEYTSSVISGAAATAPVAQPTTPPAPGGVPSTTVPTVPATPEKTEPAAGKGSPEAKPAVPKSADGSKK